MAKVAAAKTPSRRADAKQKARSFPIVGMGGSAGSFKSIEKFFTHMSGDSGMAFVIIMHLDPDHKGHLAELIQNFTQMPVKEAADGMQLQPDTVYIIPPNKDMGVHNRKLLLLNPAKSHGFRQPIDYFLQSLAEDQWNKAVAIIFSGMGSDGETGVRMIKEKLGMAMVQDPLTAQYDSMPLASIETNQVDYVLTPEEMPIRLIQYMNHPVMSDDISQPRSEITTANSIDKILMLLRSHTGHDFSQYKKSTITRRIDRRIAYFQLPDYAAYVNHLRENPQEIGALFNELLIGVTRFFRDEPAFEALKKRIVTFLSFKKNDEPARVWIAGCSTGEEAYSVAILLIEALEKLPEKRLPKIQIFATDLDSEAIELARAGQYHDNIAAYVSAERLERFFIHREGRYIAKKELREMIVFAQHNLIKDAPFTRLDLLCCRNVMIYLTAELQKRLIPVFHYSLNTNGIMFMGPAETIGGFTDMFSVIDPKWKLFERKDAALAPGTLVDFPFSVSKLPSHAIRINESHNMVGKRTPEATFSRLLLENFTPASVLINEKGDILYSNGKTGRFLELPHGEANMNIYRMAREELRYVLGNVIHQAQTQRGLVEIHNIKIKEDKQYRMLNLKASIVEEANLQGMVLIVFEDKGIFRTNPRKRPKAGEDSKNAMVEELEKELVYTKQQLNSTIEQMETSLEELKSTNEELQSTNEELQSTNEESLTTKEEMQSLNEELMTINVQYQAKAEELSRINNDMKNLLDATEIGTIFLDNQMNILRFTPQVRNVFHLIASDIGRSITHISANFDYPQLENDIHEVIERLASKETEVKTKNGEWYTLRIIPYRTLDNFISGAVLTFTLITGYKQLKYKLKALQSYTAELVNGISDAVIQLDSELNILTVNEKFMQLFHVKERSVKDSSFLDFAKHHLSFRNLKEHFTNCKETGTPFKTRIQINENTERSYELSANPFVDEGVSETLLIMVIINDFSN